MHSCSRTSVIRHPINSVGRGGARVLRKGWALSHRTPRGIILLNKKKITVYSQSSCRSCGTKMHPSQRGFINAFHPSEEGPRWGVNSDDEKIWRSGSRVVQQQSRSRPAPRRNRDRASRKFHFTCQSRASFDPADEDEVRAGVILMTSCLMIHLVHCAFASRLIM